MRQFNIWDDAGLLVANNTDLAANNADATYCVARGLTILIARIAIVGYGNYWNLRATFACGTISGTTDPFKTHQGIPKSTTQKVT